MHQMGLAMAVMAPQGLVLWSLPYQVKGRDCGDGGCTSRTWISLSLCVYEKAVLYSYIDIYYIHTHTMFLLHYIFVHLRVHTHTIYIYIYTVCKHVLFVSRLLLNGLSNCAL